MIVALGLFITTALGFCVVNLFAPRISGVEKLASGYGIGLALITFMMFILSWAGIPLSIWTMMIPSVGIIAILAVCRRRREKHAWTPGEPAHGARHSGKFLDPLELVLCAGIVVLVGVTVVQAAYWPVRSFDALCHYDNLSRLFYSQRSVIPDQYTIESYGVLLDYPLHIPLSNCMVYLFAGNCEVNPKLLYVIYYVCLLAVFYKRCLCRLRRMDALLGVLLLASTPNIFSYVPWTSPYFPYYYYYALAVFYLCEFIWTDDAGMLILGAISLSFLVWVRPASEVILLGIAAVFALYALFRRRWFPMLVLPLAACAVYVPWIAYIAAMNKTSALVRLPQDSFGDIFQWNKFIYVLKNCTFKYLFLSPRESGVVWCIFIVAALYNIIRRRSYGALLGFITMTLAALTGLFYLTGVWRNFSAQWGLFAQSAASRLLPMLVTPALYFVTLVFLAQNRFRTRVLNDDAPLK